MKIIRLFLLLPLIVCAAYGWPEFSEDASEAADTAVTTAREVRDDAMELYDDGVEMAQDLHEDAVDLYGEAVETYEEVANHPATRTFLEFGGRAAEEVNDVIAAR